MANYKRVPEPLYAAVSNRRIVYRRRGSYNDDVGGTGALARVARSGYSRAGRAGGRIGRSVSGLSLRYQNYRYYFSRYKPSDTGKHVRPRVRYTHDARSSCTPYVVPPIYGLKFRRTPSGVVRTPKLRNNMLL